MNYVIFDLEWNRDAKKVKLKCPDEIIQIGAVKYDDELKYLGSFSEMIKPSFYDRLEPMVQRITGLTMNILKSDGLPFPKAFKEFKEFIGKESVLLSWGIQDAAILRENSVYYNRNINLGWLKRFADLQGYVTGDKSIKAEQNQLGLKTAALHFNINFDEDALHNALADAELSGEIFVKTFDKIRLLKSIIDARKIRAHYKGIHIIDLKSNEIDKREFFARCPKCGRFTAKTTGWYRRDKGFFAIFRCQRCKIDLFSTVDVLMAIDNTIKYKKRCSIIEKAEM